MSNYISSGNKRFILEKGLGFVCSQNTIKLLIPRSNYRAIKRRRTITKRARQTDYVSDKQYRIRIYSDRQDSFLTAEQKIELPSGEFVIITEKRNLKIFVIFDLSQFKTSTFKFWVPSLSRVSSPLPF